MMRRRQAQLDLQRRPPPRSRDVLELGALADVREKLPLDVTLDGRPFRVVELDGELVAHSTVCPHWLGPLEAGKREGSVLACPWHDYRFDLRTGRSCDGRGLRLGPAPAVRIESGQVSCLLERMRAANISAGSVRRRDGRPGPLVPHVHNFQRAGTRTATGSYLRPRLHRVRDRRTQLRRSQSSRPNRRLRDGRSWPTCSASPARSPAEIDLSAATTGARRSSATRADHRAGSSGAGNVVSTAPAGRNFDEVI
jgi:nitrite reductase/ring-hydroxylating ferredoxin subunit